MLYDVNSYQNVSYYTKLNNNEKQIFDNPIKLLKPALIPVSLDAKITVNQENIFKDIIYQNNDISNYNNNAIYRQTEYKINNINNKNKIVLPKKVFSINNNYNNRNTSEDSINYENDTHNTSIKYNNSNINRNTISFITNVEANIENNNYCI